MINDRPRMEATATAKRRDLAHERRPLGFNISARPKALSDVRTTPGGFKGLYKPPQEFQAPMVLVKPTGLAYAETDGESHINIYSRGKTELGRQLSHFWKKPFTHPFYGKFNSMEGFWYYIKAARPDDRLRELFGWEAKFYGRELPQGPFMESFYDVIIEANFHKITQHQGLVDEMVASELPFDHYYLLPPGPIFVRKAGFEWLVEGIEQIRRELKAAAQAGNQPLWPTPTYEAHLS